MPIVAVVLVLERVGDVATPRSPRGLFFNVYRAVCPICLLLEVNVGNILPGLHRLTNALLLLRGETGVDGVGQINFHVAVTIVKPQVVPRDLLAGLIRGVGRLGFAPKPVGPGSDSGKF